MSTDPFKVRSNKPPAKQPLVLSEARLNELIRNSKTDQDVKDYEKARQEERKLRQQATKELSKLIMQRKEPGSELNKRQYTQDVKQAQLDIERESRINARRNYVLDQAYKRLYEETDRVKYFKTAKSLAETLHQRNKQVEAKTNMADNFSHYDDEFILRMMRDTDNYRQEETDKVVKALENKKKNAKNWTKQIENVQKKKNEEEWEHLRDGFMIREDAENYAEELRKAELEKCKKKQEYGCILDKQRNEKISLLDAYSKLDEVDEKRAEIFNKAKRDMKMKHGEIKKKLENQKELKRQYVANNLKDNRITQKIQEEANLQKAIRQADAKFTEECVQKHIKREERLKSIKEHYEKEMHKKAEREIEKKREGFRDRRNTLELVEEQNKAEDIKRDKKKKLEKESQHIQLHQIAKKQTDKKVEKLEDVKDYLNHIRSLNDEEEVFQKYAQMEIADFESRGLDTRAMHYAARPGIECGKGPLFERRGYIRPKYYSAISEGDELNHIQRIKNQPDSKSRLGFTLQSFINYEVKKI